MRACREELRALGSGGAGRYALLMHLMTLYDYALISGTTVKRCLEIFDGDA